MCSIRKTTFYKYFNYTYIHNMHMQLLILHTLSKTIKLTCAQKKYRNMYHIQYTTCQISCIPKTNWRSRHCFTQAADATTYSKLWGFLEHPFIIYMSILPIFAFIGKKLPVTFCKQASTLQIRYKKPFVKRKPLQESRFKM